MKQVSIPAPIWRGVTHDLLEIKQAVQVEDLVNREQARLILGVSSKTFSNRKIAPDSINEFGECFYSKKRLKGIK